MENKKLSYPIVSIIVAMARDRAIGIDGTLPWHLPDDLAHFKDTTWGHAIIMGRHTFESLPNGPLPGRRNIVVSTTMKHANGVEVYGSIAMAMKACRTDDTIFIIGGEQIYRQTISIADRLYITEIDSTTEHADSWFPAYDGWKLKEKTQRQGYAFCVYERKKDNRQASVGIGDGDVIDI